MSPTCRVSSFVGRVHHPVRLPTALTSRARPPTKSSLGTSPHVHANSITRCYHPYPEPRVSVTNTYVSPYVHPELKYDPAFFDKRRNFQRNGISKERHRPRPRNINPDYLNLENLSEEELAGILRPKKREFGSKPKTEVMDYCLAEPRRDEDGEVVWPAPRVAMEEAREFITDCAKNGKRVVIAPDKDADGLTSGVILYRTLIALGLPESNITVHLISKGHSIHDDSERNTISNLEPTHLIVLDQGSRPGPAIIPDGATRTLIIDHHQSTLFPSNALILTASQHPPIATTSLLTWTLLHPLVPTLISESTAYLACIGTHGDLGNTLKWLPPFPDMTPTLKTYTRKAIHAAIPLLNAPRRTARYDVHTAWTALLASTHPTDLRTNARLLAASAEVRAETERCTHTPPKFSRDGKIAVLRIRSEAQVHPVIATRWAGYLRSQRLEMVMCANEGYQDGVVNFSCRVAKCAVARLRGSGREVDIIASLEKAAASSSSGEEGGLRERLGTSFARGHREASGGIVPVEAFEELMRVLGVGEKGDKGEGSPEKKKKIKTLEKTPQKNTLRSYFQMGSGGKGDGKTESERNGSFGSQKMEGETSKEGEGASDVDSLAASSSSSKDGDGAVTPTQTKKQKRAKSSSKSASLSPSEARSSETVERVEAGSTKSQGNRRRKKTNEVEGASEPEAGASSESPAVAAEVAEVAEEAVSEKRAGS